MALIKCPECGKKISDQCESCPNCGYPIKANSEAIANSPTDREEKTPHEGKKPIFKQVWFWIAIVVVIAAAVTTIILLLNRDVKPKVDENGQPMFVELTDEVYTNADKYLGYYVNIKGKVFQNLGDSGEVKGVQVWIDPDNCEQNLMIHYTTEGSFKDGDYVICTGYIKEIHTYTNTYGTELSVPLVYSTDLRSASYIEVMAPTVSTIIPENLTYEQYGYSITIDKVEFAENETRLYLTATNNGKATWYVDVDASAIIQNGKQFNSEKNYDANYEEVPYNLSKGISASGIVTFPAVGDGDFEYVLEMHSDDFDERFENVVFKISKDISSTFVPVDSPNAVWSFDELKHETHGYTIAVDKVEFYNDETRIYLSVNNDGKATFYVDTDGSIIVQNKKQFNTEYIYDADYKELPYGIVKGASATGAVSFPSVDVAEFEYIIEIHSDDYDEEFKDVVFKINLNVGQQEDQTQPTETTGPNTKPDSGTSLETTAPNKNQEAMAAAENYRNMHNGENLSIYDLIDYLTQLGYGDEEITYVVENVEGFNMGEAVEPTVYAKMLYDEGYNRAEIIQSFVDGGMTRDEAISITDSCGIDWNAEALARMKEYVQDNPQEIQHYIPNDYKNAWFFEGFSSSHVNYAIQNCGIDWYAEAVETVQVYDLNLPNWSSKYEGRLVTKNEMVQELVDVGFTTAQAQYGVENSGIDWGSRE